MPMQRIPSTDEGVCRYPEEKFPFITRLHRFTLVYPGLSMGAAYGTCAQGEEEQ
jgi:hypothetical protein